MNKSKHPALLLALLAVLLGLVLFGIHSYRHRFVRQNIDIVQLLPHGDTTTFFIDASALRQTGYGNLLAGSNAAKDPDYAQFSRATNFDYTRDIDAVAGSTIANEVSVFVKGRFDWSRLRAYANAHNGTCTENECKLPASRPPLWISWAEMQPDIMALSVSPDSNAAATLAQSRPEKNDLTPAEPIWIQPAHSLLQVPNTLPYGLRVFAIALQSEQSLTISLGRGINGNALELRLTAVFQNPAIADTAREQLIAGTKLLTTELNREHAPPSPADLTGLLVSGHFVTTSKTLTGTWPVSKDFLNNLR